MGITVDEWLAEMEQVFSYASEEGSGASGFSAKDLAAHLGCVPETAQRRISQAIQSGKVEFVGKQKRYGVTGVLYPVPVYRPVRQSIEDEVENE